LTFPNKFDTLPKKRLSPDVAGQMTKDIKCCMETPIETSYSQKKAFDGPVIRNQNPKPGTSGNHIENSWVLKKGIT